MIKRNKTFGIPPILGQLQATHNMAYENAKKNAEEDAERQLEENMRKEDAFNHDREIFRPLDEING